MNIKRIASVTSVVLSVILVIFFILVIGSFLTEGGRILLAFITGGVVLIDCFAIVTGWIYARGEKAGRTEVE